MRTYFLVEVVVLVYVVLTGKIRHKINAKYETITTGRNIQYLGKPKLAARRNIFEGIECFGFGALKQSLSLSFVAHRRTRCILIGYTRCKIARIR